MDEAGSSGVSEEKFFLAWSWRGSCLGVCPAGASPCQDSDLTLQKQRSGPQDQASIASLFHLWDSSTRNFIIWLLTPPGQSLGDGAPSASPPPSKVTSLQWSVPALLPVPLPWPPQTFR